MQSNPFPIEFDLGRHSRAKIGFVLLATEQTIEDDMMRIMPEGVGVHFTRAPIPDSITRASLTKLAESLGESAALILPDGSLDVITYACTSGSLVVGEEKVFCELAKGAPLVQHSSLITAVIRALNAIKAQKIVIVTPYLDEINTMEEVYLTECGFDVLDIQGLQIEKDSEMVCVTPESISRFAKSVDRDDADAIFISCGALRSVDIVDQLEVEIGKPVICSNQAMAWDVLRLAGINDSINGFGQLLKDH